MLVETPVGPRHRLAKFLQDLNQESFCDVSALPESLAACTSLPELPIDSDTSDSSNSATSDCQHASLISQLATGTRSAARFACVLHWGPAALGGDGSKHLMLYQLLSGLAQLHLRGLYHGSLIPEEVLLTQERRMLLQLPEQLPGVLQPDVDLAALTAAWCRRQMSTLDYLLRINELAGRCMNDPSCHPMLPWVLDMTLRPDLQRQAVKGVPLGWRDLGQSKWRLTKGDEQLDHTYTTSQPAHHISDEPLSELTYCIYKARTLPQELLQARVRATFAAHEYPASMQRLYQWSPDECIPEFYTDAAIFKSGHPDMPDLAVPSWAASPKDFLQWHRSALESDRVSANLHHWIDLTFGYKLTGQPAIEAKNVALPHTDTSTFATTGRAQLFQRPHPVRHPRTAALNHDWSPDSTPRISAAPAVKHPRQPLQQGLHTADSSRDLPPTSAFATAVHQPEGGLPQRRPQAVPELAASPALQQVQQLREMEARHLVQHGQTTVASNADLEGELSPEAVSEAEAIKRKGARVVGGQAADVRAFGRIVVQLYKGRRIFVGGDKLSFWEAEAESLQGAVRHLALACLKSGMQPASASALLDSSVFSLDVRAADAFLTRLSSQAEAHAQPASSQSLLSALDDELQAGGLSALQPAAAKLCIPAITATLQQALAAQEPDSLAQLLPRILVQLFEQLASCQDLIDKLLYLLSECLGHQHGQAVSAAVLQPAVFLAALEAAGTAAFLAGLLPAVLAHALEAPQAADRAVWEHAMQVLRCLCGKLPTPLLIRHLVQPFILSLPLGPHIALSLAALASSLDSHIITMELLPSLVDVLVSPASPDSLGLHAATDSTAGIRDAPSTLANAQETAMIALEALVSDAASQQMLQLVVAVPTSENRAVLLRAPLVQLLIQPECAALRRGALRMRLAALLLQICKAAAGPDLTLQLIPQILPLFGYKPDQQARFGSGRPPTAHPSTEEMQHPHDDSAYWDLVYILYPEMVDTLGSSTARQLLAGWKALEHSLQERYSWIAPVSKSKLTAAQLATLRGRFAALAQGSQGSASAVGRDPDLVTQAEQAARLIEGVGWLAPRASSSGKMVQGPWHAAAASASQRPGHGNWDWLPPGHMDAPGSQSCFWNTSVHGKPGAMWWARPWQLSTAVIRSWRAHREGLRLMVAHEDEGSIATAGQGTKEGQECEVIRCWQLSDLSPGVQYTGHGTNEVTSMVMLPGSSRLIASADAQGSIHVWSSQTGILATQFGPGAPLPSAEQSHAMTGWFPDHVGHTSAARGQAKPNVKPSIKAGKPFPYTCVQVSASGKADLAAGTAQGRIQWLSVERCAAMSSLACWPSDKNVHSVQCIDCAHSSLAAAGSASGYASIANARCGAPVVWWRAHNAALTHVRFVASDSFQLLTSAQDGSMKLWDTRKCAGLLHDSPTGPAAFTAALVHSFPEHQEEVGCLSVFDRASISCSGSQICLAALQPPFNTSSSVLTGSDADALKDAPTIMSMAVLGMSRLMLFADAAGFVRVCR